MAKWATVAPTWTPVAVADTTNMTDGGHHTLQGGSTTQRLDILEVKVGGQAPSASSPCILLFGRTSTVGATLTAIRNAAFDPATAALAAPPTAYQASTTKPQRSATLGALLPMSFNAYGGIYRWLAREGEEISLLGNVASFGELSLNAFTGGTPGLVDSGIVYEPK
jgi:hypothetical protein